MPVAGWERNCNWKCEANTPLMLSAGKILAEDNWVAQYMHPGRTDMFTMKMPIEPEVKKGEEEEKVHCGHAQDGCFALVKRRMDKCTGWPLYLGKTITYRIRILQTCYFHFSFSDWTLPEKGLHAYTHVHINTFPFKNSLNTESIQHFPTPEHLRPQKRSKTDGCTQYSNNTHRDFG